MNMIIVLFSFALVVLCNFFSFDRKTNSYKANTEQVTRLFRRAYILLRVIRYRRIKAKNIIKLKRA